MQYELTSSEIQHIEKYRKLQPRDREAVDEVIDRMVWLDAEIARLEKEKGEK